MKHEFNYFYPMDIRSSGKDLINNHLTFAIYNHAAIFPEEKWPLSMRTNGHLMLNGKKMSKSTGNSLTLREAVESSTVTAKRWQVPVLINHFEQWREHPPHPCSKFSEFTYRRLTGVCGFA